MTRYQDFETYYEKLNDLLFREDTLQLNEGGHLEQYFSTVDKLWQVGREEQDTQSKENAIVPDKYKQFGESFNKLFLENVFNGSEINVWAISGLKDDEVRNTAVLGWWLDKNANHSLGSVLLRQVISDHLGSDQVVIDSCKEKNYKLRCESLPLRELENRIDIEIMADDFLMFWEVKINATEGKKGKQLKAYYELLQRKSKMSNTNQKPYLIYLTKKHKDLSNREEDVISLTWADIRYSFLNVYDDLSAKYSNHLPTQLLYQYCQFLERFNK
ncbi:MULTISPECIES: PD-(D/E)XK nuclease family protein [Vibrio]|uniref:PD-(D/E)XK nuclease family protein n=1 Tax=Vibrio TaxID=662 RepID=UPI0013313EC5|nr:MULTISPECIES: PD-(D/E)XK nuclease family protein [Vibrio]MCG6221537.1 PD-(D/E)XK nuclease family protein [Vibrio diabolicus]MDF5453475.1 PD-(D/E)XK nuclease family protein [Vibrio parahaemolyticus]MDW1977405.1 PD-(D/E)XK nuclease family protein [Vibrio sp. Vb1980]NMS06392.1 PD-(D/E)XK nuclease family protein [Vibrio parahaemolyticus]